MPPTLRGFWINATLLMVKPVLHSICANEFKRVFPSSTEFLNPKMDKFSHLEAFARSLQGVAPWLELQQDPEAVELAETARCALDLATDPSSQQYMQFAAAPKTHPQPLVDAALLAHGLLRAPTQLWARLDPRVQSNLVAALRLTRSIPPKENNWLLFASLVETVLLKLGGVQPQQERLLRGLMLHRRWYLGSGWWGDGPEFVHNYYNSYIIQPILYDILHALQGSYTPPNASVAAALFRGRDGHGAMPPPPPLPADTPRVVRERHQPLELLVRASLPRTAALLEALVAPDGSFPAVGRSIIYRTAALHVLALAALKHVLPTHVPPGQARTALTRAINFTLDERAYDKNGWLRVGVIGSQPVLAQRYSTSGSLYLAAAVFLPLGLPSDDPFWTDADMPTTWEKVWHRTGDLSKDTVIR